MSDPNATKTLEDFVKGIIEMDHKIRELNPDEIIYTIRGAVPLADLLHIVDPQIITYNEAYMPASSAIMKSKDVIYKWFLNFLKANHQIGEQQHIITIDEIVSGNSVSRVTKQVVRAIVKYSQELGMTQEEVEKEIIYHSVGILDLSRAPARSRMARYYRSLEAAGIVIPVSVEMNIVMDRPEYCPLKLKTVPKGVQGGSFLPVMENFEYSSAYIEFLERFAHFAGQDPGNVCLQNPLKIKQSEEYLAEEHRVLSNLLWVTHRK